MTSSVGQAAGLPSLGRPAACPTLAPPALLAGVVCAFVACCLAGRVVASRNPFVGFQRFHLAISPETLFYPTASQVRALGRELLDRDRVAVIVGSNSVLRGDGQRREALWTRHLQEELGDGYRVLNLAMNGACPAEFGGTAAEILSVDFPRMIFVTGVFPALLTREVVVPPGAREAALPLESVYGYFFWDAFYKDLLPTTPKRRAAIVRLSSQEQDQRLADRTRGLRVDALAYSRDLWTALAHAHLSTVWHSRVHQSLFQPRRKYADLENSVSLPREVRCPPGCLGHALGMMRGEILSGQPAALERIAQSPELIFPTALRGRTLLLLLRHSPFYEEMLSTGERSSYKATFPAVRRRLRRLGFPVVSAEEGYSEEDFFDINHLSESGGRKLAAEVAPAVRRLVHHLGYEREGCP